jgi:hypothetical protein
MGWQPGPGGAASASPDRDPGVPPASPGRDPRLAWFAAEDGRDAIEPSGVLALAADEVSARERRCPGATGDELTGLVRAWAAVESWAAAAKLGVIAEMIRRDDAPRKDGGRHGDLPDDWSPSLRHELALALACSVQAAETTIWLAWEQQARLPGVGALLADGTLTMAKARAITETFKYLTDTDTTTAESLIIGQLAGKTYTQVLRLAEQAALTVDPELAERRRCQAQKNARVTFFRELSGTAGLSGRDLPPDEALAAMAAVNVRAQQYEDSGAFGATPMDQLRAYAYVDLLKGTPAEDRIARAVALDEAAEIAEAFAWANARAARNAAQANSGHGTGAGAEPETEPEPGGPEESDVPEDSDCPVNDGRDALAASGTGEGTQDHRDENGNADRRRRDDDDDDGDDQPGGPDGDNGNGGPDVGGPTSGPGASPAGRAFQARPSDLIVPLLTLLRLAERPGEIQGFGLLDPALAGEMAAAAVVGPRTEVCVTVTSPEGYAIGHGCARPDRSARSSQPADVPQAVGLPARLNLTIPAAALTSLAHHADSAGPWRFTPRGSTGPPDATGPPDGYGTWTLVLADGRRFTVRLDVVPTFHCDHRYETPGYHPSARLRHLVQVRDGTCTFPSCNRHARESDFEHAQPYHKGGRTCSCNAGARSRACHRVKQSPGWSVTQPRPGWHQWMTPSGRSYLQEPKRYLA